MMPRTKEFIRLFTTANGHHVSVSWRAYSSSGLVAGVFTLDGRPTDVWVMSRTLSSVSRITLDGKDVWVGRQELSAGESMTVEQELAA